MRRRIKFRLSCAAGNDKAVICALANPQSRGDRSTGGLLAGRFTRGLLAHRQRVYLKQHAVRGELGEPGSGYARSCFLPSFLPSFLRQAQDNRKYSGRPALRRAQARPSTGSGPSAGSGLSGMKAQACPSTGSGRTEIRAQGIGCKGVGPPFDRLRANGNTDSGPSAGSGQSGMKAQACPSPGSGRTEMSMDRGSGLVDRASGLAFTQRSWHCRTLVGI